MFRPFHAFTSRALGPNAKSQSKLGYQNLAVSSTRNISLIMTSCVWSLEPWDEFEVACQISSWFLSMDNIQQIADAVQKDLELIVRASVQQGRTRLTCLRNELYSNSFHAVLAWICGLAKFQCCIGTVTVVVYWSNIIEFQIKTYFRFWNVLILFDSSLFLFDSSEVELQNNFISFRFPLWILNPSLLTLFYKSKHIYQIKQTWL